MEYTDRLVRQPHLGEPHLIYKPEEEMFKLSLGKVVSYNHTYHTAVVQLLKTHSVLGYDDSNSGKLGVKIGTTGCSYDSTMDAVMGSVESLKSGQIVVIGFIDGVKTQPIILCSLHDVWSGNATVLPSTEPVNIVDRDKHLRVFPSQSYIKVDGLGGIEYSHPSGMFFISTHDDIDFDSFGVEDLTEKDPVTGSNYKPRILETAVPQSVLFCKKDSYSSTNSVRLMLSKDGTTTLRRKTDKGNSDVTIDADGTIKMVHNTGSKIELNSNGDIVISASNRIVFIENGLNDQGGV